MAGIFIVYGDYGVSGSVMRPGACSSLLLTVDAQSPLLHSDVVQMREFVK